MKVQLLQRAPLKGASSGVGAVVYGTLAAASIAASAYHGAKRHGGSVGVIWFDDRCPADLKGVRRRRKGGRHGARA